MPILRTVLVLGALLVATLPVDARPPQKGRELRLGLYRIGGVNPKQHYTWRPTGAETFHVPQAFGTLRLR